MSDLPGDSDLVVRLKRTADKQLNPPLLLSAAKHDDRQSQRVLVRVLLTAL